MFLILTLIFRVLVHALLISAKLGLTLVDKTLKKGTQSTEVGQTVSRAARFGVRSAKAVISVLLVVSWILRILTWLIAFVYLIVAIFIVFYAILLVIIAFGAVEWFKKPETVEEVAQVITYIGGIFI